MAKCDKTVDSVTDFVTQHRHWFSDMSGALPEFDPVKSTITIDQWIDKVEKYAVLYEWDDVAMQHFALAKLTGVARMWRDSLPRAERTWIDWVTLLKNNFPVTTVEDVVQLKSDAQHFSRKSGQIFLREDRKMQSSRYERCREYTMGGTWIGKQSIP